MALHHCGYVVDLGTSIDCGPDTAGIVSANASSTGRDGTGSEISITSMCATRYGHRTESLLQLIQVIDRYDELVACGSSTKHHRQPARLPPTQQLC